MIPLRLGAFPVQKGRYEELEGVAYRARMIVRFVGG
jgi:hypothetical protein